MVLFPKEAKAVIESLLFVSNEPLNIEQISEITGINPGEISELIEEIARVYETDEHGFYLREVAGGFIFMTKPQFKNYIEKLYKPHLNSLSHAALETLAIIAYKQPITRSEIELIRGVKVDKIISTLVEKKLIEELGRKETPGRPILYGTTKEFLKYFGLKDLAELPALENFITEKDED